MLCYGGWVVGCAAVLRVAMRPGVRRGRPFSAPLAAALALLLRGAAGALGGAAVADPWAALGLEAGADDGAVSEAFRRLAREHHPDKVRAGAGRPGLCYEACGAVGRAAMALLPRGDTIGQRPKTLKCAQPRRWQHCTRGRPAWFRLRPGSVWDRI